MNNRTTRGNEIDLLFHSAMMLLAEEEGAADLETMKAEPTTPAMPSGIAIAAGNSSAESDSRQPRYKAGKGNWKRHFTKIAACAAALLLCVGLIGLPWATDSKETSQEYVYHAIDSTTGGGAIRNNSSSQSTGQIQDASSSPKERTAFENAILSHMFVYAGEERYDFGMKYSIVIPESALSWTDASSDGITLPKGIVGFDNSEIYKLTYQCEKGELICDLLPTEVAPEQLSDEDKKRAKDNRYVEFKYYEGYHRAITWFVDSKKIFLEIDKDGADLSTIEPDVLTINVVMDDASEFEIKAEMSYTSEGNVKVEIVEWNAVA